MRVAARSASRRPARRAAVALLLLPLLAGCAACPPAWAGSPPVEPGFLHAAGSAGQVFVDADATSLALTRAARSIADALGLDVETRLSVVAADGRLFVEAVGAEGPTAALDDLELVDRVECDRRVYVLVRLPLP